MLRLLLALALFVVAVPAQWLGPTNVYISGGSADVFVVAGRVYLLVWSRSPASASPAVELWGKEQTTPGRLPAGGLAHPK
jgi:hypothetical protein